MKISFLLLFLISMMGNAQILDRYPKDQKAYKGGYTGMISDFKKIYSEGDFPECGDEIAEIQVVVYPDSTIKFVKPENPDLAKCTINVSKSVLSKMKDWIPAEVNGEKHASLYKMKILLSKLKADSPENYISDARYTNAEFPGGIGAFRALIARNVDVSRYTANIDFSLKVRFEVGTDGKIDNIYLSESSGNKGFDADVLRGVQYVSKKWKPATFYGVPTTATFTLPLSFRF